MNNPVKDSGGVSLSEAQEGTLFGLWRRCPDGYRWRSDYKAAGKSGGLGPWLMPTSSEHQDYPMLRSKNLLADFIRLGSTNTPDDILRFAGRYGMLGFPQPVVAPDRTFGLGEALADWSAEVSQLRHLAETLSAVEVLRNEQHEGLEKVNSAMRLLRERLVPAKDGAVLYHIAAQRSATHQKALGFVLGRCTVCGNEQEGEQHTSQRFSIGQEVGEGTPLQVRWSGTELTEIAHTFLTKRLTERLRGHVDLVLIEDGDGALLRHAPDTLLAALDLQFALRVAGIGARERPCEHCRKPFFLKRRDQRFCDKQCRENAGYHRRRNLSAD